MKTVHFASILVLSAVTAFACNDDGDRLDGGTSGSAGKSNSAGSPGTPSAAGSGGEAAGAGGAAAGASGSAGASEGGAAGDAGAAGAGAAGANEGGAAGANEGGAAGANEGGAAGANEGGAGGASEVAEVVVPGPLALIGSWKDPEWGGLEVITATTWNGSNIVAYDSGVREVYTHNSASSFYPGKYSKYVYTEPADDSFYFCTILYASPSLEAAQADTKVADPSKLEDQGCDGFNWTKVEKQ